MDSIDIALSRAHSRLTRKTYRAAARRADKRYKTKERARRRAAGLVPIEAWVPREKVRQARELIAQLCAQS